jgi:hypothetical protein
MGLACNKCLHPISGFTTSQHVDEVCVQCGGESQREYSVQYSPNTILDTAGEYTTPIRPVSPTPDYYPAVELAKETQLDRIEKMLKELLEKDKIPVRRQK